MSAISSLMMGYYTTLMNNSAYSMMSNANSRMALTNSAGAMGGSGDINFKALNELDTQMDLQNIQDSFNYQYSKAMLKNLKKLQEDDAKKFDTFA